MKLYASLMNGEMAIRVNFILRLILVRLSFWSKSTAAKVIRAVSDYDYRGVYEAIMYKIGARIRVLLDKFPARKELYQWRKAYWDLYDEWEIADLNHRNLHAKYTDMMEELRYWETRHAKVLNYVEKRMEHDELGELK